MIWNRVDYGFERGYASAARYAAAHGHLRVAGSYVDEDGFKLGAWLNNQRSKRESLSPERRRQLESLGLCWEGRYAEQWEQAFELARRYREFHGDLKIPAACEIDGVLLGRWLRRQEEQYANGTLSEERAQKLLALGMTLPKKPGWEDRYREAKAYFEENGCLSISPSHATKREASLYNWLRAQRQAYAKGTLDKRRAEALEAIGATLESPSRAAWKNRFLQVASCYDPLRGKPASADPALGDWFRRQKGAAEQGRLKPWQMELWRTLPMSMDEWERSFQRASSFYQENGHLRVTSGSLWHWLRKQRQAYRGQEGAALTAEQIRRLESIGMEWLTDHDRSWQMGYEAAAEYFQRHGRLDVKTGYVTEQGYPLGNWLYEQKRRYQAGSLEKAQLKALKAIHTPWLTAGKTQASGMRGSLQKD